MTPRRRVGGVRRQLDWSPLATVTSPRFSSIVPNPLPLLRDRERLQELDQACRRPSVEGPFDNVGSEER